MSTYYTILGLPAEATESEIKSRYKKLAFQFHPDQNPDNPQAEEKFKEINEAYQILSDPDKRAQYDQILQYGSLYAMMQTYTQQEQEETVQTHPRDRYRRRKHYNNSNYEKTYVRPDPPKKVERQKVYISVILGLFVIAIFCRNAYFFMEELTAEMWLEQAQIAYSEKEYAAAASYVNDALLKAPELPELHYFKAYMNLGYYSDYKRALFHFSQAIQFGKERDMTDAEMTKYYLGRGEARVKLKEYLSAFHDFEKMLSLEPENARASFFMGEVYLYGRKSYAKAIPFYQKASQDSLFTQEATLGEAIALYQEKDFEKSYTKLQNALSRKPNDGVCYYYRGLIYLNAYQDTLQACMDLERARSRGVKEANWMQRRYCMKDSSWYSNLYGN